MKDGHIEQQPEIIILTAIGLLTETLLFEHMMCNNE
jgi:hypothetical protein